MATRKNLLAGTAVIAAVLGATTVANYYVSKHSSSYQRQSPAQVQVQKTEAAQKRYELPKRSARPARFSAEILETTDSLCGGTELPGAMDRPAYAARLDVDGDGGSDLFCLARRPGNPYDTITIYTTHSGSPQPEVKMSFGIRPLGFGNPALGVDLIDFNGDRLPDVIVRTARGTVLVRGDTWEYCGEYSKIVIADVNENGLPEIYRLIPAVAGGTMPPILAIREWSSAKNFFDYTIPYYTPVPDILQGFGPLKNFVDDLRYVQSAPESEQQRLFAQFSENYPPELMSLYARAASESMMYGSSGEHVLEMNESAGRIAAAAADPRYSQSDLSAEIERVLQTVPPEYRSAVALNAVGSVPPEQLERLLAYHAAQRELSKPLPMFIFSAIGRGYAQATREKEAERVWKEHVSDPYVPAPGWGDPYRPQVRMENPDYRPQQPPAAKPQPAVNPNVPNPVKQGIDVLHKVGEKIIPPPQQQPPRKRP